jgi:hypothetical protein
LLPIGTRLWKEFRSDGVRVETRLLEKTGEGAWRTLAYAWDESDADATLVPGGVENARGTDRGDPAQSAIAHRMGARDSLVQMPPLASEVVDEMGVAAIEAWITALAE